MMTVNNKLESMLTETVVGNVTYSPVFCLQVLRNIKINPNPQYGTSLQRYCCTVNYTK
jgi:hypothetical protein